MGQSDEVGRSVRELSQFFVGDETMLHTLHRVANLATDAVVPAAFCGLTMLIDGEPRTGVFTDSASAEIDQAQYDSGRGPCLDAFRTGEIMRIESTADDARWPEFSGACLEHGIMSTASFPMEIDEVRHGALNLYSKREAAFGADELAVGRQFAAHAGVVLAYARSYWNARQLSDHLTQAMAHRAEIEQAKGIIIGAHGCSADAAFEILVRQSQHENRKLRAVAIDLVQSKQRHPRTPPRPERSEGPRVEIGQNWQAIGDNEDWFTVVHAGDIPNTWVVRMGVGLERQIDEEHLLERYRRRSS